MKPVLLFFITLLISGASYAQTPTPEILTNAKIVSMVRAALPKAVIIKSIENKQGNFDTSTDAMIALKKQGVPDDIITAMVGKVSAPIAAKAAPAETPAPADGKHVYAVVQKSKECEVVTGKNNVGQTVTMVQALPGTAIFYSPKRTEKSS